MAMALYLSLDFSHQNCETYYVSHRLTLADSPDIPIHKHKHGVKLATTILRLININDLSMKS